MKHLSQKERMRSLFKRGRWVKVQELQRIAWRYGARIWDLKKEGLKFEKRRQECGLEEWRLI